MTPTDPLIDLIMPIVNPKNEPIGRFGIIRQDIDPDDLLPPVAPVLISTHYHAGRTGYSTLQVINNFKFDAYIDGRPYGLDDKWIVVVTCVVTYDSSKNSFLVHELVEAGWCRIAKNKEELTSHYNGPPKKHPQFNAFKKCISDLDIFLKTNEVDIHFLIQDRIIETIDGAIKSLQIVIDQYNINQSKPKIKSELCYPLIHSVQTIINTLGYIINGYSMVDKINRIGGTVSEAAAKIVEYTALKDSYSTILKELKDLYASLEKQETITTVEDFVKKCPENEYIQFLNRVYQGASPESKTAFKFLIDASRNYSTRQNYMRGHPAYLDLLRMYRY